MALLEDMNFDGMACRLCVEHFKQASSSSTLLLFTLIRCSPGSSASLLSFTPLKIILKRAFLKINASFHTERIIMTGILFFPPVEKHPQNNPLLSFMIPEDHIVVFPSVEGRRTSSLEMFIRLHIRVLDISTFL